LIPDADEDEMGISVVVMEEGDVEGIIVDTADTVPEMVELVEDAIVAPELEEEQMSSIMSSKKVVASPAMVITVDPAGELLPCVEGVVRIDSTVRMLLARSIGRAKGIDLLVPSPGNVDSCCCCCCCCRCCSW
jgi:hypothetical protein